MKSIITVLAILTTFSVFSQFTFERKVIYSGTQSANPNDLTIYNGGLYFAASNLFPPASNNQTELHRIQSSASQPESLLNLDGSGSSATANLFTMSGSLFFSAGNYTSYRTEIYKYQGANNPPERLTFYYLTGNNTVLGSSVENSLILRPTHFLFQGFDDSNNSSTLWRCDGTQASTAIVKTFPSNWFLNKADVNGVQSFAVSNSAISYMLLRNNTLNQVEIWMTDGSDSGTTGTGIIFDSIDYMFLEGEDLYFNGEEDNLHELYKYNRISGNLTQITDNPLAIGTNPIKYIKIGNEILFTGSVGNFYDEQLLKIENGIPVLVKDLYVQSELFETNGKIYFYGHDSDYNLSGIWESDGTTAGTNLVVINNQIDDFISPVKLGDFVYFGTYQYGGLWATDFTTAGTTLLTDYNNPDVPNRAGGNLKLYEGKLFFAGSDSEEGRELWSLTGPSSLPQTTWINGSWDNGLPDPTKKAIVAENYTTGDMGLGSFEAMQLDVINGAALTISSDTYIRIESDITIENNSAITVSHQGNLVQVDENATTINNGNLNVTIETPFLEGRDFMLLGSPMSSSSETVFTDVGPLMSGLAQKILNHDTSNFQAYEPPAGEDPIVGVNFVDQDSNDWTEFTGNLTPGEGYFVRQSLTEDGSYSYNFNDGIFNNGAINYTAIFNGIKENSPSIIANPYASAIDGAQFIENNDIVDEIYFWEHLTEPSTNIPGPLNANFSMEDISIFNGLMGNPAANDPTGTTTPNGIISTSQGFAFKANTSGDVTFNNTLRLTDGNTTLRSQVDKDLLWISVRESEYSMGSTTALGFTENATQELDAGLDSQKMGTIVSLYSHLPDGQERLGIQGREPINSETIVKLGFSTQIEATLAYTISISDLQGVFIENSPIILIDKLLDTQTTLSDVDYTFTSNKSIYDDRFEIRFNQNPILNITDSFLNEIKIYPNPADNFIIIDAKKTLNASIIITDMLGKKLFNKNYQTLKNQKIDTTFLSEGIYIITIKTSSKDFNKRFVKK